MFSPPFVPALIYNDSQYRLTLPSEVHETVITGTQMFVAFLLVLRIAFACEFKHTQM